ncbi:MAG: high frequency lysogenization protein HflD [Aestuariibacter sp.]
MDKFTETQIALAGVCQSALLVKNLARNGELQEQAFETSIRSIVNTDPESVIDVYGKLDNLKVGLQALLLQLSSTKSAKDTELTRYIASLLTLERKLNRSGDAVSQIGQRIADVQRQVQHFSLFDPQIISNLASIYKDNISPLTHKIQVAGNPTILKQQTVQDKVRALLLAGIRSAFLWRQLGGKRRDIILKRNKIVQATEQLIKQLEHYPQERG